MLLQHAAARARAARLCRRPPSQAGAEAARARRMHARRWPAPPTPRTCTWGRGAPAAPGPRPTQDSHRPPRGRGGRPKCAAGAAAALAALQSAAGGGAAARGAAARHTPLAAAWQPPAWRRRRPPPPWAARRARDWLPDVTRARGAGAADARPPPCCDRGVYRPAPCPFGAARPRCAARAQPADVDALLGARCQAPFSHACRVNRKARPRAARPPRPLHASGARAAAGARWLHALRVRARLQAPGLAQAPRLAGCADGSLQPRFPATQSACPPPPPLAYPLALRPNRTALTSRPRIADNP